MLRKSWESPEKVVRKFWESPGKVLCKFWECSVDLNIPNLCLWQTPTNPNNQAPKYKAFQISVVCQWKAGGWQLVDDWRFYWKQLLRVFDCTSWQSPYCMFVASFMAQLLWSLCVLAQSRTGHLEVGLGIQRRMRRSSSSKIYRQLTKYI